MSISVLMTTYNCGEYISYAIQSVLNQTYKDFELLVIDDGSTDGTDKIVKRFKDERIRYFIREHKGRAASLNFALQLASYDLVALMDADDISHPLRIERQLRDFNSKENSISCTWSIYFRDDILKFNVKTPSDKLIFKNKMALHSYICNPSVIFNKKFILSNGGYLEELINSEDYELWLRLLNKAEFFVCTEYLLFQRQRNDSLSRQDIEETRKQVNIIHRKYESLSHYFSINNIYKQMILAGWREYFYGSRKKAREKWAELGLKLILFPKVFLALIFTYFNDKYFNWFWEKRFRLQIIFKIEKLFYPKIREAENFLVDFIKNYHNK